MLRLDCFSDCPINATVDGCSGFIVHGTHTSCGKSSFAFQAAMTATAAGETALVVCSESVLYRKLPHPKSPMEAAPAEQLARIHFSYATSLSQARRTLASLVAERPAVIIVEDDGLDDAADSCSWLKTLGVLDGTVDWLRNSCGVADARFVFVTNNFDASGRFLLPYCSHAAVITVSSPSDIIVRPPWAAPFTLTC